MNRYYGSLFVGHADFRQNPQGLIIGGTDPRDDIVVMLVGKVKFRVGRLGKHDGIRMVFEQPPQLGVEVFGIRTDSHSRCDWMKGTRQEVESGLALDPLNEQGEFFDFEIYLKRPLMFSHSLSIFNWVFQEYRNGALAAGHHFDRWTLCLNEA